MTDQVDIARPKHIGARIKRTEDPRLLTGFGSYTDDRQVARVLHVAFRRSEHPHARIVSIDCACACVAPGVVAVLTADTDRLVAFYGAAAYSTRRASLPLAVAGAATALTIVLLDSSEHAYSSVAAVAVVAGAWLLGDNARVRREREQELARSAVADERARRGSSLSALRNTEWLRDSGLGAGPRGVACDAGCRVFDMYGIVFRDNPDLRPILLYEGFVGHPLRKYYPKLQEQPLVPYRTY